MTKTSTLGELLKKERKHKDISLEFVSSKTNISVNTLTALENEDMEQIPGAFYFRNYIKNYLEALGLDADDFFQAHHEAIETAYRKKTENPVPDVYCSKLKYSRFKKKNIFLSLLMTAVLFVVMFYFLYSNKENIFSGWSTRTPSIAIPSTGIDFAAIGTPERFSLDYSPVHVSVEFKAKCWTQVKRGGNKVYEQMFNAGDKLSLKGYHLNVFLGIPLNTRVLIGGKEVTYLKSREKSVRLDIMPSTVEDILKRKSKVIRQI